MLGKAHTPASIALVLLRLARDAAPDERRAFLRGAKALSASAPGRPEIDDGRLVRQALGLFETREAGSLWEACVRVARTVAPRADVRVFAERLRRKAQKKISHEMF